MEPACEQMEQAVLRYNTDELRMSLLQLIPDFTMIPYNRQNLESLAATLSRQCFISADLACFDCIKTLPPQSEIRFKWNRIGTGYTKIIDLCANPNQTIRLVAIHD
ncbi:MAG: hypothetical protein U0T56_10335 [Ferruginibacter sp.]